MTALLSLRNVHAGYGAIRALQGVSFDVEPNSMVALLGVNGAGKSTTLKVISGMVRPTSGSVHFEGKPLAGRSPNQMVKMGVAHVPEGRKIFKDLAVAENLLMGAYTRKDSAGIRRDMDMVLALFPRLGERSRQLGASLSGGEQQMLAIGRGLMARPKLLLLDEPSLGIAPNLVLDIFAALRKINAESGMTMLIVEQNAHVALRNTTFGYVLQVGKVAVSGQSEELRRNKEVVESYMGSQG
jgi:branched-chain amino acid transport system ATP-binding protein